MLRANGLNKGDYTIKPVGATFKRLDALQQDKTNSASMLNPPFSLRAERAGLKDLGAAITAIGPYQATGAFVMRAWAKDNADVLVNYLQAYIEGLRWSFDPANKAEAAKLLAEALKLPSDIAEQTYRIAADPKDGLAQDGKLDIEGFKTVLKLRAAFAGGTAPAPDKYIDLAYYQRALAGLK